MFPHGKIKVLFVGTAVIDRVMEVNGLPGPNGTAVVGTGRTAFGGRGAGPAATYGLLGGQAGLLTAVGSDFVTSGFEEFLGDSLVDLSLISRSTLDRCHSTNTYVDIDSRSTQCFFEPRQLGEELSAATLSALSAAEALYVAGYYSHEGLARAADAGRSGVPMALSLCNGIVPFVSGELLEALIAAATVIAFNDEEWLLLKNRLNIRDEFDLFDFSVALECVYHTRGAETGVGILCDGSRFAVPVRVVRQCRSALGAGDTFMAGVLYGFLLDRDYVEAAAIGSLLASLKIENSLGATFPTERAGSIKDDLMALISSSGIVV